MINESPFLKKERYADRVFLPPPWGLNGFLPHLPGDESPGYDLSPRWGSPRVTHTIFRKTAAPKGRQKKARGGIHAVDAAPGIWISKITQALKGRQKISVRLKFVTLNAQSPWGLLHPDTILPDIPCCVTEKAQSSLCNTKRSLLSL